MKSKEHMLLIDAVNKSEYPGHCRYCGDENQPLCVIAQIGFIYGIKPNEWSEYAGIVHPTNSILSQKLPYDYDLLKALQEEWDATILGCPIELDDRRSYMINMVDDYYATSAEIASKTHPYSDYHRTSLEQSLGDE